MKHLYSIVTLIVLLCGASNTRAAVILSNMPGTGTYTVSGAVALTPSNWAAVGFKSKSTAENFVSFRGEFISAIGGLLEGGIYSDNAGNPGSLLSAFTNVTIPGSTTAAFTINTASTFTLQPTTNYWVVLHDAVAYSWVRDNSTSGTAPTASAGYAFNGYRTSASSGSVWSNFTGSNLTVEISTTVPEPASLGLLGVGAATLLRRRVR